MVELWSGAQIEYDWSAISQEEWLLLLDKTTDEDTNNILVGKLIGLTADEYTDLNPVDYRKIAVGMWASYMAEINTSESKNLAGASTEQ